MRKVFSILLALNIVFFNLGVTAIADQEMLVRAEFVQVLPSDYKNSNVTDKYKVYNMFIHNVSMHPLLLASDSELFFVLNDGTVFKSETRRQLYKNVKTNEMGKYRFFAKPGAFIANVVTWVTFSLAAPLGVGILIGTSAPAEKAAAENVNISQELFNRNCLPIKLDPDSQYNVRVLVPKKFDIDEIVITNISFDLVNMYELRIRARN